MAATVELAPIFLRAMHEVSPVGKGAHKRDRKPVTYRLANTSLILHVVGKMRQGVSLCMPTLIGDFLVATGKRDRLERQEVNLLRIIQRKLHDASDLLVVDPIEDRDDGHDIDARGVQVLNRL